MENKTPKYALAFFAAVAIISLTAAISAAADGEKNAPDIKQKVYSFKVEGFNKDKKLEWGLEGESADVVLNKINIKKLKGFYYGKDGTVTIVADRGIYDKNTHNVELMDNIVGTTADGGEFITDYANWNAESEEITTESRVTVKRDNILCKGRGLVTKPRLKWVKFEQDVEVEFGPGKKIICSGPFILDHENNIATFEENVVIQDPDSETFTDKLTVYLDPETNKIIRVVTEGNVRVVHTGALENMGKLEF